MNHRLVSISLVILAASLAGCASESSGKGDPSAESNVISSPKAESASLDPILRPVEAGIDVPTEVPLPHVQVLEVAGARIFVPEAASLEAPLAGFEYPTDAPMPASLAGKRVLVLGEAHRLVVDVELAQAGIDYPTDAPPRDFVVWAFGPTLRRDVAEVASIEFAVAGIDYPTETAADFLVAVLRSDERIALR